MEMLSEAKGEGHQGKRGELGRAVGEDGGRSDEEVAKAVYAEVRIDDAGARVSANRSTAHGVASVVEIGDGSGEIGCEERWIPVEAVEAEVSAEVLREGAKRREFGRIDTPVENGLEVRRECDA
jgi:hypothetical protein